MYTRSQFDVDPNTNNTYFLFKLIFYILRENAGFSDLEAETRILSFFK